MIDNLNSTFENCKNGPIRKIHTNYIPEVQYEDLRLVPVSKQEQIISLAWETEKSIAYRMEQLPLFRLRIIQLSNNDSTLFFSAHHIIADAWSSWILMSELLEAHDSFI